MWLPFRELALGGLWILLPLIVIIALLDGELRLAVAALVEIGVALADGRIGLASFATWLQHTIAIAV